MAGSLFAIPLTHCVDDIICVEPEELVDSGHLAFKILCTATGWAISSNKAPPPSAAFLVIGVVLDLSKTPDGDAVLQVSAKRVAQLEKILGEIKRTAKLGPGAAASLTGKLGFSLCACFGRFGRAKLRPLIRRAGENRTGMNVQIESAIDFWATFFRRYMPRPVPMFLEDPDTVVSYSDGEGSHAGVGIAVWSSRLPDGPLAAFLESLSTSAGCGTADERRTTAASSLSRRWARWQF